MKRTTVSLPGPVAEALARESQRRRVPVSQVVRESLTTTLGLGEAGDVRPLPFAALGRSDGSGTARRAEQILDEEWPALVDRR